MATYRKRGDKWEYRIRDKDLIGDGKPISKGGFRTKSEAKAEATRIENQLQAGMDVNAGQTPFADYYKRWIEAYKIGVHSKDNDAEYRLSEQLIREHFKDTQLKDVTKLAYQDFLNEYSEGKAQATVKKRHKKIAPALRDAFASGHILRDVTQNVTFRGRESQKESEKYLHYHEAEKLLDALLDDLKPEWTTRYMIILQLATGMRIGEVMGLQFKDLDFLHNEVNIDKQWDYKYTHSFVPTKNKETRVINVNQETMNIMREFYDYQKAQKVQDNHQRLFAVNGSLRGVDGVNEMLKRACKRAGIRKVTSHAMRHTHASILILEGVDIVYISERLGHKSITITLETYSHVLDELKAKGDKESVEVMAGLFK